ncbi:MAG: hypothetical protein H8D23_05855 [Candidatus Brocadiales bacterium]|nr:hypothetical protein [Candidatus Brocadiales bacterium]
MKINFPIPLEQIMIKIETRPSNGPDPVFDLAVKGTGEVLYFGHDFVDMLGEHNTNISQEKVRDLVAAAMEIDILEMKPKYMTEQVYELLPGGTLDRGEISASGHQMKVFTLQLGENIKTIEAYLGYPQRLNGFYDRVLELSSAIGWIGVIGGSGNA